MLFDTNRKRRGIILDPAFNSVPLAVHSTNRSARSPEMRPMCSKMWVMGVT